MKQNKNYPRYVKKVFAYFDGCKEGEGLYLYRSLLAKRKEFTPIEWQQMHFTIYNLIDQGYLVYKQGDFIVLTQDGYDYMQGDDMPCNEVNLKNQMVS